MTQGNTIINKYSVLMSVYALENTDNLSQSIQSMFSQTILPDEFVLVCDGPLTDGLEHVIEDYQKTEGARFKVVRLEKHGGLTKALNIGLSHCSNDYVARMDSDDISYKDRCEKQLKLLNWNQELAICSGIVDEFVESASFITTRRVLPESHEDIYKYSKYRNPFNHPCVMYKKSVIEKLGGYEEYFLLEDYQLWIKLLLSGYKGYNIQESILYMRTGSTLYKRRGGVKYAVSQVKLFCFMLKKRHITFFQFVSSCIIRIILAVIPNKLRNVIYDNLIRK